ncbi:MAG: hypothetical protein JRJ65_00125 [Deltaproteobacteria bacterium]|nr:hypothetical protein [Deltaproteobacteria bacterium]
MPEHSAEVTNAKKTEDVTVVSKEKISMKITNKISFSKTARDMTIIWPMTEPRSKSRDPRLMPKKIIK